MTAKIKSDRRKQIKKVLSFDNKEYPCIFCREVYSIENLTIEHIVPKKHNGSNRLSNLALSCIRCNRNRGTTDFAIYSKYTIQQSYNNKLKEVK